LGAPVKTARYLLVVVAGILGFWPQHATHAAGAPILLVSPFEGHSGDPFYLSGSGYLPNQPLSLVIACPSLFGFSTARDRNVAILSGPTTNPDGTFSGYAITGFRLHVLPASPCVIYAVYASATVASGYFVGTALYNIVAPNMPLPARAIVIEGHVRATPPRVRAGAKEKIHIYGAWGGAFALVTIRFLHQKPRTIGPIHLDWRGQADRTVAVDSSAASQPGNATVSVTFSLGDKYGGTRTSFTVVR
jgi:hypothetical protein